MKIFTLILIAFTMALLINDTNAYTGGNSPSGQKYCIHHLIQQNITERYAVVDINSACPTPPPHASGGLHTSEKDHPEECAEHQITLQNQ